jgi:hypothetical protein
LLSLFADRAEGVVGVLFVDVFQVVEHGSSFIEYPYGLCYIES